MELENVTLGTIAEQLVENYGADYPLHGALVVLWHPDNSVGAAYAGTEIAPVQTLDLALSGAKAMLAQIQNLEAPPAPKSGGEMRLVDSDDE